MEKFKAFRYFVLLGITLLTFQQSFSQSTKFSVIELENMLKSNATNVKKKIEQKGYKFNSISSSGDVNSFDETNEPLFSFSFIDDKVPTITFYNQNKEQSEELVKKLKISGYKLNTNEEKVKSYTKKNVEFIINHFIKAAGYLITVSSVK